MWIKAAFQVAPEADEQLARAGQINFDDINDDTSTLLDNWMNDTS